jgi:hypothetical protein
MKASIIPEAYFKKICKIGQGADCCRYLGCGKDGFECLKNTELQGILDKRAEDKSMSAQADNCAGYDVKEQMQ